MLSDGQFYHIEIERERERGGREEEEGGRERRKKRGG